MSYDAPNQNFAPTNTPTAKGEFGGNITQMVWQVRGRERQVYTLQYDFLNRMTEAHYSELNSIGGRTKDIDQYMEKLTYDARGNILTLQRNGLNASCGSSLIDNLTYGYNTSGTNINRLNSVTDAADLTKGFKLKQGQTAGGTYTYDLNGNLITDPNKGITSIVYNHLNLPEKITFVDGNIIQWLYDASGTKLRKTTTQVTANTTTLALDGVPIANNIFTNNGLITSKGTIPNGGNVTMIGSLGVELQPGFTAETGSTFVAYQAASGTVNTQDYIGGFEYKNGVLEAVYHAEGRITTINGVMKYEYALKDHLGNTRVMFCDKDGNGRIDQNANQELSEVSQENHYYPFGMAMEGVWSNTPSITDNKYQYNGKELNDDFGLGWMDYGARMYDAAIGKWNAVDPLAVKNPSGNPYRYCFDNPIMFIDPDGRSESGYITGKDNKLYYDKNIKSQEQVDKRFGKDSGLKYQGETVTLKNPTTGERMFGDENGQLSMMPKEDVVISAPKMTTGFGPASFTIGVSITSAWAVGGQSGFDAVWISKGPDASFFPYIVGNYGVGGGYNSDVDIHAGIGFYNGADEEVTAKNLLDTGWDSNGWTGSASASALFEGGINYSYSKAGDVTGYHNVSLSAGLSNSPGYNGYLGRYTSGNIGRVDQIAIKFIINYLKNIKK